MDAAQTMPIALDALATVNFNPTRSLRSIWQDPPDHVPSLNRDVLERLLRTLNEAGEAAQAANPRGLVIVGQAGAGKTHLLGTLRAEVWRRGGWFVLLHLLSVTEFWTTAALGYVEALFQPMPDGRTQGEALLRFILESFAIAGEPQDDLAANDAARGLRGAQAVLGALRRGTPQDAREHRDIVLAFACLHAGDFTLQDVARSWLQGVDVGEAGRRDLGVIATRVEPQQTVAGLSWLMSLAGPTLCAIDQIDAIVSVARAAAGAEPEAEAARLRAQAVIDGLAGGLMGLFDLSRRTVTVVSTLQATWDIVRERALASAPARFHMPVLLRSIGDPPTARQIVERRLAASYARTDFAPPYPSWPFRAEAFESAIGLTPRELLERCEQHRDACLARGEPIELADFGLTAGTEAPASGHMSLLNPARGDLDARFATLLTEKLPQDPLASGADPSIMARLLRAGLQALVVQAPVVQSRGTGGDEMSLAIDAPGLHAMLRDGDRLHGFCVITQTNHLSVRSKLRAAIDGSGLDRALPFRHLYLIRRTPWPGGDKTAELVRRAEQLGARIIVPGEDELRRLNALSVLFEESPLGLVAWLRATRPIGSTSVFGRLGLVREAFPPEAAGPDRAGQGQAGTGQVGTGQAGTGQAGTVVADAIPLGTGADSDRPIVLPLAVLPHHVALVAGAASGKATLLRRIVEEAALLDIPSIVIDPGNDLVRLGEAWPDPPAAFTVEDSIKAQKLRERSEVVIWTPGNARGNPLTLGPLPDFAAIKDDADEREAAVSAARAALQPLIAAGGALGKQRSGVLTEALRHFARSVGGHFDDLIGFLRDLPPGVSRNDRAKALARDVAHDLDAARSLNPLLEGLGAPTDPRVLLTGTHGRTRVSVINLSALPTGQARSDFVARLLLALFGSIRRHATVGGQPAQASPGVVPNGLPRALLVIDEADVFAPSTAETASRTAMAALMRQASKYGLGVMLATEAPRALDAAILEACAARIVGRLGAPVALDASAALLAERGGTADDLGSLPARTFYVSLGGSLPPSKFRAPLCLTHNPGHPPSNEDVVARAAKSRALLSS